MYKKILNLCYVYCSLMIYLELYAQNSKVRDKIKSLDHALTFFFLPEIIINIIFDKLKIQWDK